MLLDEHVIAKQFYYIPIPFLGMPYCQLLTIHSSRGDWGGGGWGGIPCPLWRNRSDLMNEPCRQDRNLLQLYTAYSKMTDCSTLSVIFAILCNFCKYNCKKTKFSLCKGAISNPILFCLCMQSCNRGLIVQIISIRLFNTNKICF